jgi:hypothetical protein
MMSGRGEAGATLSPQQRMEYSSARRMRGALTLRCESDTLAEATYRT